MKWSRHRMWIKLSHFLDHTILQFPFTTIMIPIIIIDWHKLPFVGISICIDLSIWALLFMYQHYMSLIKLRKGLKTCLKGKYEVISSKMIETFADIIRSDYSVPGSWVTKIIMNITSIKVVRSDNVKRKFTTIADLSGISIIIVKKRFEENSVRDIVLLAHEFGHVYHTFLRYQRFLMAFIAVGYQCVLLVVALYTNSWIPFCIILPINLFLAGQTIWEFESQIEINADISALQIIERVWNNEDMHTAAECLLRLRIATSVGLVKKLPQFTVNNCIASLIPQVYYNVRTSLIDSSYRRSAEIEMDQTMDLKTKKAKLENEILIRMYLAEKPFRQTTIHTKTDGRSGFSIILFLSSLITTLYSSISCFGFEKYTGGWFPLWISFGSFILLAIIFIKISGIICDKKDQLQAQIGLA